MTAERRIAKRTGREDTIESYTYAMMADRVESRPIHDRMLSRLLWHLNDLRSAAGGAGKYVDEDVARRRRRPGSSPPVAFFRFDATGGTTAANWIDKKPPGAYTEEVELDEAGAMEESEAAGREELFSRSEEANGLFVYCSADGRLRRSVGRPTESPTVRTDEPVSDGEWHHVVATLEYVTGGCPTLLGPSSLREAISAPKATSTSTALPTRWASAIRCPRIRPKLTT